MKSYKVAIVGCGAIHETHVQALKNQDNVIISMFCDDIEEKAVNSANKYSGKAITDFNEVLDDKEIDVVHICTPHYLHTPMALEAIKKDKHVFLEKPMSMTSKEALLLINAADKSKKQVGICFQNRYNSTSVKTKELLESNELGKVLCARAFITWNRDANYYKSSTWRGKRSTEGGGLLINQAIHTLDLLQWFLGDIELITGNISTRKLNDIIEVEDTAEAYIKFKNGASALFYGSNCYSVNAPIQIDIVCEKAILRIENDLIIKWNNGKIERFEECNKKTGEKSYWGLGHNLIISDFYDCINTGRTFSIGPKEAIKSNYMIDNIVNISKF